MASQTSPTILNPTSSNPQDIEDRELFSVNKQLQTFMDSRDKINRTAVKVLAAASAPQVKETPAVAAVKPQVPLLPPIAFGSAKWKEYFDLQIEEPALPADIHAILTSPCPFVPGKKVEETHMLTLIPKEMTLNKIGELVQKPLQGYATKYDWDEIINKIGNTPIKNSYWVLITRDVLPGSRSKIYKDQLRLVETYRQKTKLSYEVPLLLEATLSIFLEYIRRGVRLYSRNPVTFTHCQEKIDDFQLVVGGFASGGLYVGHFPYYAFDRDVLGVGAVRKFS